MCGWVGRDHCGQVFQFLALGALFLCPFLAFLILWVLYHDTGLSLSLHALALPLYLVTGLAVLVAVVQLIRRCCRQPVPPVYVD